MASSPSRPAASSEEHRRTTRKLQKKRPDMPDSTPELPGPLQDSDDSADEQFPDHMATPMSVNMNQSIFGLIAAAGSRVDFNTRFDGNSSDEDENKDTQPGAQGLSQTTVLPSSSKGQRHSHKKSRSKHRLLKSLATLPKLKSKAKRESSRLSAPNLEVGGATDEPSDSSEPSSQPTVALPRSSKRRPSVMSRMLEARAEMSSRPSFDTERTSSDMRAADDGSDATLLARRLMEIFEFDEPEQVVEGNILFLPFPDAGYTCTDHLRRISLLALAERSSPRVSVHYCQTYLLLCIPTQESGN